MEVNGKKNVEETQKAEFEFSATKKFENCSQILLC